MVESPKNSDSESVHDLSEAERMSRIRDLLVGPVIADEQARHDQSMDRLDQTLAAQERTIADLQARLDAFEQTRRAETERQDLRLLGMVEALLVDERQLRARLVESDPLRSYLGVVTERAKGSASSG